MTRRKSPSRRSKIPSYRRQRRKGTHDLAFVEISGKRTYLGPWDTPESREAYHRLLAEIEANVGSLPAPAYQITIAELVNQYIDWADGYYVKNGHPTAEPGDIRCAVRPLLKLYGRTPAREFGPRSLKSVRQEMIETGWVRRHINKQVERIKRMIKWAVADEIVPPSSYHALQAVAGLKYGRCKAHDNPPVQPAPIELVKTAKRHVSRQVAAMIDLQLLTGARPGEIVQLRPCDVDRSDEKVWKYRPREHKTQHHGRDRIVFLGPKAQEVLQPFLLRNPESHCFSPSEANAAHRRRKHARRKTPLSCGNRPGTNRTADPKCQPGSHYTTASYRRAITRACEKAFPPPVYAGRALTSGIHSGVSWPRRARASTRSAP